MGLNFTADAGQTPLDEEERLGLLLNHIGTREELDEFEQLNIQKAMEWSMFKKFEMETLMSEKFIKELHLRMFGDVWAWAGKFRSSNKNLGIEWHRIQSDLKQLLDDCNYWILNNTYGPEETAIHFKHRLVSIHCFANGNGRHSRLMADLIVSKLFNKPVFTWGLNHAETARTKYLEALRQADKGEIKVLVDFAES